MIFWKRYSGGFMLKGQMQAMIEEYKNRRYINIHEVINIRNAKISL